MATGDPEYNPKTHRLPAVSGVVPGTHIGNYLGYTVRETAGAAATLTLYDSATAPTGTTPILEEITLTAFESTRDHYPDPGREVDHAIWAQITGTVEGSVFQ